MEQGQFKINIILFVDALDEYAGSDGEIVDFLVDCAKERPKSGTNLKICIFSRPFDAFLDSTILRDLPGFYIQDYRGGDILYFVSQRILQMAPPRIPQRAGRTYWPRKSVLKPKACSMGAACRR